VDSVTWLQACDFLERITARSSTYQYRLPTEAEWEYAARAGTTDPLHGVSAPDVGWWEANANGETHPVGQKMPNPWGLHDMLGNVWEWCSDWGGAGDGDYYSRSPSVDPTGPDAGMFKVLRGGAFYLPYKKLRVSVRNYDLPIQSLRKTARYA
jgi:formylglycine-generating enzyme required for sulfatase activity